METNQKIGIGALTAIIVTLSILGGIKITDEDVFYCEYSSTAMQCDRLSQYYSLENGKCWNEEVGNKLCKTGWLEVFKNESLHEYNGRDWICDGKDMYSICTRSGTHKAYKYQLE